MAMIRKRRSLSSSKKTVAPPPARRVAPRRTRKEGPSSKASTLDFANLSQAQKQQLIQRHLSQRQKQQPSERQMRRWIMGIVAIM